MEFEFIAYMETVIPIACEINAQNQFKHKPRNSTAFEITHPLEVLKNLPSPSHHLAYNN